MVGGLPPLLFLFVENVLTSPTGLAALAFASAALRSSAAARFAALLTFLPGSYLFFNYLERILA